MKRLVIAILRREPWGHIRDLWDIWRGNVEVRGVAPNHYLLRRRS